MDMVWIDQVYNGDFLLAQEVVPGFPDGWIKTGGDSATSWEWLGQPSGPRAIAIHHPTGPRAGVAQGIDVPMQAGNDQRWEVKVTIEANPGCVACYLRVYMGNGGQHIFLLNPGEMPEVIRKVFATPVGTGGIRLEIGIIGAGDLKIHLVEADRLYPPRELRLDEKGQIYVRQVDTVGQIQKPVAARIVSPLPLPVEATIKAIITEDIRDLTPARDGVRIYGSSGTPYNTTSDGLAQIQVAGHYYEESLENQIADSVLRATIMRDVSALSVYSYAVYNAGTVSVSVGLEISPDGSVWAVDTPERLIAPGSLEVFTPAYFLRYNRLIFHADAPSPLIMWFQAQS